MKKAIVLAALAIAALALTGCGSMRTHAGPNNNKVWYNTFFGISIESAVYGDGIIVKQ